MAACTNCGNRAGVGKTICEECVARDAAERARADQHARLEHEHRQAERGKEFVAASRAKMLAALDAGTDVWLYRSTHVAVDAQIESVVEPLGLDLRGVYEAGWAGWEVVSIVPRTYSGTQSYYAVSSMTMRDWGGQRTEQQLGLSENVIGVYVLQRLRITPGRLSVPNGDIDQAILENYRPE